MYLYMYIVFVLYLTCYITWSIDFIVTQSISSGLYDLYLDLLDFEINEWMASSHVKYVKTFIFFFFLISWGGVRLSPLGLSAINWPIAPVPDHTRVWNVIGREN
jgi:hypothetical protein